VPLLLALPDKFRGSATAAEVGQAMAQAGADCGWDCALVPVSDGGEGLLECFGGPNRLTTVTGPLGEPVDAGWRLDGDRAVIEMAAASGLSLVAGRNDPLAATTTGTGELIAAALDAGATSVLVGVGGSATTDGGAGAVDVLAQRAPLTAVTVAADVSTLFVDAAAVFAPQKGADAEMVTHLTRRLSELAGGYRNRFGVGVAELPGSGAAGGLGGGLAALGATIRPGFQVVADQLGLAGRISEADLVLTGEGRLDRTSLAGKAPVGVVRLCAAAGVPVALVVGDRAAGIDPGAPVVSLTARIGRQAALARPLPEIRAVARELLGRMAAGHSDWHRLDD
jgi:glycerate 2-kinase